jgi:UDP-N-acetylmuramoylalanine--D-glutamate ligase
MRLGNLGKKKILILGFGREGQSTLKFLRKVFPKKEIGIADQKNLSDFPKKTQKEILKDKNLKVFLGKNYLSSLSQFDLIIKTPGIPLSSFKKYLRKNQKVILAVEIFLEAHKQDTIGVTGTKGKSTTTSLVFHILKQKFKNVFLAGNIEKPVLDFYFKKGKFVCEFSSHQLQNLKISPHVAIFLNIFPEHQDYYKTFDEYFLAKKNIFLWQKEEDFLIYNFDDPLLKKELKKAKAKKIVFSLKKLPKDQNGAFFKGKTIYFNFFGKKGKVLLSSLPLFGEFNKRNILAAFCAAKIFEVSDIKIKKGIETFKPLPHRLEVVGEFQKILFINDSLATTPQSTIQAIKTFKNKVDTLIAGGYDRGQDYKDLAKKIKEAKVRNLILFPDTGQRLKEELAKDSKFLPKIFLVSSMKDAVKISFKVTSKGKICLLSPAAASFNLFKDYKERGNLFKKWVKFYGKNFKR